MLPFVSRRSIVNDVSYPLYEHFHFTVISFLLHLYDDYVVLRKKGMLQYPPPPPFMEVLVVQPFSVWLFPIIFSKYVVSVVRRTQRDYYLRPLLQLLNYYFIVINLLWHHLINQLNHALVSILYKTNSKVTILMYA